MEMTRVDTIGNKKTSYNLLAPSDAHKMETKPKGSSRYRCLIIFICFLSILFLISFVVAFLGYQQTKSDIEELKLEVSHLRNELNAKVKDEKKKLPKEQSDFVEKSQKLYEEHSKWLNEKLKNETKNMNEWKEEIEKTIQSASQNLLEKIVDASQENELSHSNFSVSIEESEKEIATLRRNFEEMQARINITDQSLSSYIANAVDGNVSIQNRIHQLEEFDGKIDQRVLDLNNTVQMLNESLNASILSIRQDTSLKLNNINQALKTEIDLFQNKTIQIEDGIKEMNTTIHDLSRPVVPDVDTEQLKGELASITINSSDASVSNEELKRVEEELKNLQERVTTDIDTLSDEENKLKRNVTRIEDGFKSLNVNVDNLSEKTVSLSNRMERFATIVHKFLEKNKP